MIYIADLPPPINGASQINFDLARVVKTKIKEPVVIINTAQTGQMVLGKAVLRFKLIRIIYSLLLLVFAVSRANHHTVYRSIYGGKGQVYDIFILLICRLSRKNIIIHHHSFKYLSRESKLFKLLTLVAGNKSIHVVLGNKMREALVTIYHVEISNIKIISNSAFISCHSGINETRSDKINNEVVKIGHLSNLTKEKGLHTFLEVAEFFKNDRGLLFELGGSTSSLNDEHKLRKYIRNHENLKYHGPIYGTDKEIFFKDIDIFLFPSNYENEAEPLVVYEAAKHGALIIGSDAGCLEDVLSSLQGEVIKNQSVNDYASSIRANITKSNLSSDCRKARTKIYHYLHRTERSKLNQIFGQIHEK